MIGKFTSGKDYFVWFVEESQQNTKPNFKPFCEDSQAGQRQKKSQKNKV